MPIPENCAPAFQLHTFKGVKNDFIYYITPPKKAKPEGSFHSMEFLDNVTFKHDLKNNFSEYLEGYFTKKQIFDAEQNYLFVNKVLKQINLMLL